MDNPLHLTYYQPRKFTISLCGQNVQVITKPGLPDWDKVAPGVQLLAEVVSLKKDYQVLLLGCGNGALGVAIGRQVNEGMLQMVDTSWIALRIARMTMAENELTHVPVEPVHYPFPAQTYRTVVINLPKGRKLARRWLVEAWAALEPGGEMYLAGANSEGIQSVIQDAKSLCGNATVLAYRKGCRVARMLKQSKPDVESGQVITWTPGSDIPWTTEPGIARGSWVEFTASVGGNILTVRSLPGVFSVNHADSGTEFLLQQIHQQDLQGKRVLDFGCGYGLIGLVVARLGAAWVDMLDVDLSAVTSAQENCTQNMILNTQVRPSDVLDAIGLERYDLILSNPPFHSGKQVDYSVAHTFVTHSRFILNPGGRLLLVANRFIRYDRLMREVYGNVEVIAETGKFHVLGSVR
jgi:16S rRNA (guanine1207-N2)-methyltransferase